MNSNNWSNAFLLTIALKPFENYYIHKESPAWPPESLNQIKQCMSSIFIVSYGGKHKLERLNKWAFIGLHL